MDDDDDDDDDDEDDDEDELELDDELEDGLTTTPSSVSSLKSLIDISARHALMLIYPALLMAGLSYVSFPICWSLIYAV